MNLIDQDKLELGKTEYKDLEAITSSIDALAKNASKILKCKYVRSTRVDKKDGKLILKLYNCKQEEILLMIYKKGGDFASLISSYDQ